MEYSTIALLALIAYAIYVYVKKHYNFFKDRNILYVPATPILGNMKDAFLRRKHFSDAIRDIYNYNKEAKYIGAFNFIQPIFVLRDPELIKSVTIKNFDNFVDHQNFVDVTIDPYFGGNLFGLTGNMWKETRNLLTPAFTSSKMKSMFELMVKCVVNVTNHVTEQAADPKNVVPLKDLFTRYTNDVIASCAFGIEIDSLKHPTNEFYVLGREVTNFEGVLSLKLFMSRAFPALMKLLRIKIVPDHIGDFFKDIVKRTVAMRDEKGISRPDMIQLMMDARGKTSELKLDIVEMTAQAFIFFFGGFDTSSTQMCIIAHELVINPDTQERLQAEIDNVLIETKGKPTYEAINSMPYLDAIFYESLRRHPQASLLDRLCTKAFEMPPQVPGAKPFTVQPGMVLWVPVSAIQSDEQYFDDPKKFYPERYLNKKVNINQGENLGFGIGPRSCIGNRFAILETKILFFYLLAKFSLKPNAKTCKTFEYKTNTITIIPKGGYWVTFEPRRNLQY